MRVQEEPLHRGTSITGTYLLFFFFTLVTGPRRCLSLKLSDTRGYEPRIRARLGTTTHFCEVVGGVAGGHGNPHGCRGRRPRRCSPSSSLLLSSLELSDTNVYDP